MKYRKKPVVIEAFQLGHGQMPAWFMREVDAGKIRLWPYGENYVEIVTLEGVMRGEYGDFVIQGINGEIYPCKPDIFEKTYELVE